jgi:DNA-3-methyladenine glycosylase
MRHPDTLALSFYARDALIVAKALIGVRIVHGKRVARIVETEAYRGPRDLACHARAGLTKRTRVLLGPPAHAYVFFIYGMHECFNVVCLAEGSGHAVLVRAAELVSGEEDGARGDGPGRFARAMHLTRAQNGASLLTRELHLLERERRVRIATSARVGVGYAGEWADKPYRFFDADSRAVSRPPKSSIGRGTPVRQGDAHTTKRT